MNTHAFRHNQLALTAGARGILQGETKTAAELGVKRSFVRYYRRKLTDPNFHPGTWGGARNIKFDDETQQAIENYVYQKLNLDPRLTATEVARRLQNKGLHVTDQ
jgi:hypothetical protein